MSRLIGVPGFRAWGHPGLILPHAGRRLPAGFLWCRGGNVSRTVYAALFEELNPIGPCTFTIATPGVVNFPGHGFGEGDGVIFQTSNTLPAALVAGTWYYVRNPAANTFNVSATPASALIAFADVGLGTHTCQGLGFGIGDGATTFGLPDLRGRTPMGCGQGSGLTNRGRGYNVGAESHTLGTTNLPPHVHAHPCSNTYGNHYTTTPGGSNAGGIAGYINTGNGPGTSVAVNNFQPSVPLNWIIQAVRL